MGTASLKAFRDRFKLPIPDDKLDEIALPQAEEGFAGTANTCSERAKRSAATCRHARRKADALEVPPLSAFEAC